MIRLHPCIFIIVIHSLIGRAISALPSCYAGRGKSISDTTVSLEQLEEQVSRVCVDLASSATDSFHLPVGHVSFRVEHMSGNVVYDDCFPAFRGILSACAISDRGASGRTSANGSIFSIINNDVPMANRATKPKPAPKPVSAPAPAPKPVQSPASKPVPLKTCKEIARLTKLSNDKDQEARLGLRSTSFDRGGYVGSIASIFKRAQKKGKACGKPFNAGDYPDHQHALMVSNAEHMITHD